MGVETKNYKGIILQVYDEAYISKADWLSANGYRSFDAIKCDDPDTADELIDEIEEEFSDFLFDHDLIES